LAIDPARIAAAYVELALAGDKPRALEAVLEPLRAGALGLGELYDEVLGPASALVGDLWHTGAITIADEHFATHLTEEVIAHARALTSNPARSRGERLVLACPPDEEHELGLRMLGDVLGANGWEVHVLGARTPVSDLVGYVGKVAPAAVALSCGTPIAIPSVIQAVEALRAADPTVPIVLGGHAVGRYPAIGGAAAADLVLDRVGEAPERLRDVLAGRVRAATRP
jgi:MerR family transcriptional regulator, light-induced transcriptional regulator